MPNSKICTWLLAVTSVLAACGDDSAGPDAKVFMDAPPNYDFSCMGNATPTTATAAVTVFGVVQEVYSAQGAPTLKTVPGAKLLACAAGAGDADCNDATNDVMTLSLDDGTFAIGPHPTGDLPYDGMLLVTHDGDRKTYLYPPAPLIADNLDIKVPIMLNAFIAQLNALGLSQSTSKAIAGMQITDCMDTPITDSTNVQLSIKENGVEILGAQTFVINGSQFSSDFAGMWFVLNVPVGVAEIGATWNGMPLRGHSMTMVAGTTSETKLRPGY